MAKRQIEPETLPVVAAPAAGPRLAEVLPADFPLGTLLSFMPDVRAKQKLEQRARAALEIDVSTAEGLQHADVALAELRIGVSDLRESFKYATNLAFTLHRRLTGLCNDFVKAGDDAVLTLSGRIDKRQRELKAEAEAERQRRQEEADRQAREMAAKAAEEAKRQAAPPSLIDALEKQAETAKAPPVAATSLTPTLEHSAPVSKWKARLKGTDADDEPNPEMADLSVAQREKVRLLMSAVVQGLAPMAAFEINWSYLNRRASNEKTTLDIEGVEAFDAGGLRAKRRR